jgi:hypothetical protein
MNSFSMAQLLLKVTLFESLAASLSTFEIAFFVRRLFQSMTICCRSTVPM